MADQRTKGRARARPFSIGWLRRGIILIFLVIAVGAWTAMPRSLLDTCDLIGYALCHRMPSHSFHLAGRQLPLCARCSGTYLGALWGLFLMGGLRRPRASRLPPVPFLALLMGFFFLQVVDGLNSYLTLFPGLPHLYEPHNLLRLATGALNGLTISALVLPLFNSALWKAPAPSPSLQHWWEVGVLVGGVGGLVALTSTGVPLLLYPLAIGSTLALVLVLTLVNTTILMMTIGQDGKVERWPQAWLPLLCGLDLSLLEIGALILVRGLATSWLGLSF